jgi:hypothetical protein
VGAWFKARCTICIGLHKSAFHRRHSLKDVVVILKLRALLLKLRAVLCLLSEQTTEGFEGLGATPTRGRGRPRTGISMLD